MVNGDRAEILLRARADTEGFVASHRDEQVADAITWLIANGLLSPEKHTRAIAMAQHSPERMDLLLLKLGLVHEEHLAQALATACALPLVRHADFPNEAQFGTLLQTDYLRAQRIAPLAQQDGTICLVMADPFNTETINAVAFKTGLRVRPAVGVGSEIDGWLAANALARPETSDNTRELADADHSDLQRLRDLAGGAPVIRWVDQLFESAIAAGSSDIHLEPSSRGLRARLRVDGHLREIAPPDPSLSEATISRIKILAKLDIAERRLPQDGRTRITIQGREIDLRIATSPTLHGEGAVLRLLDKSSATLSLDSLGLSPDTVEKLRRSIRKPNGVTLVTGPTGSGKTTTLYSALRDILTPELKFVSVEDPVEYQIDGVSQIQVKPSIDLTFAKALRSILRQDPDVLMIGEIRDKETATIAIEAALTGHQVLSTLHTNNAPATITRLMEMGVPEYLIASTLASVSAQRLVRNLCPNCAEPYQPSDALLARLPGAASLAGVQFRRPKGCSACRGTGYRGRASIAEIMMISDDIRELILRRAPEKDIRNQAMAEGMIPLLADGLRRAAAGLTSVEDVIRVAGLE
jgi:general secretion pathway protein E